MTDGSSLHHSEERACFNADCPRDHESSFWLLMAQQPPAKNKGLPAEKKILIVYLSRTNNTRTVAEIIHQIVGGKMALELETPYPADYHKTVQQVVRENETGHLPPVENKDRARGAIRHALSWLSDLGHAAAATMV